MAENKIHTDMASTNPSAEPCMAQMAKIHQPNNNQKQQTNTEKTP
jgi:hypothetical protein